MGGWWVNEHFWYLFVMDAACLPTPLPQQEDGTARCWTSLWRVDVLRRSKAL